MAELGRIWLAEFGRTWQNMAEYGRQNLVEYYSWQNTVKYGNAMSIKEELLVSAVATNLITVITNILCDLISLVLIYMRTNPIIKHYANIPTTQTIN